MEGGRERLPTLKSSKQKINYEDKQIARNKTKLLKNKYAMELKYFQESIKIWRAAPCVETME